MERKTKGAAGSMSGDSYLEIEKMIKERAALVDSEIARILNNGETKEFYKGIGNNQDTLYDSLKHVIWSGGKRIRPVMCMLACEAVGGDPTKILPTAAGIEFLHTFTLVHDDVMDNAPLRRGVPSIHSIWGEPIAITAGDALFSLAFKAIASNANVKGISPHKVKKVLDLATEKCLDLARGQTLDLLFEKAEDVKLQDYLEMVKLKTSSLIEFSLQAGAILGGGTPKEIEALGKFGSLAGTAFQIQDDILDVEGKDTGKMQCIDLYKGKKTFVVIHTLEKAPPDKKHRLLNFLSKKTKRSSDIKEIMQMIRNSKSIEYAKRTTRRLMKNAESCLDCLRKSKGKENLKKLVKYLMYREK
jgi:geranylgeranyl diphosphate synthase type I